MNLTRALSRGNLDSGLGNLDADWIRSVVGYWDLNGDAQDQAGDMHGTLVNAPTYAASLLDGRQAIELNGDNSHVNVGDLTYLNDVAQFTIAFWMNQDVLNLLDFIFIKTDGGDPLQFYTFTDGNFYIDIFLGPLDGRARLAYNTLISAGSWHHVAIVFDGSQTGDANRLQAYVDGTAVALNFVVAIPARTTDLSGNDALIGAAATSLDGKLFDFTICNAALSAKQVADLHWKSLHGEL